MLNPRQEKQYKNIPNIKLIEPDQDQNPIISYKVADEVDN